MIAPRLSRPVAANGIDVRLSGADFYRHRPELASRAVRGRHDPAMGDRLLPRGWAQFVHANAADHANTAVDGCCHPIFAHFMPLARGLFVDAPDEAAEYDRIGAFFRGKLGDPSADEARIVAIHTALVDPALHNVADLVARSGLGQRTLERLCRRHFGFSPKLLLRRQRFMRSLSQFMLDPSLKWIGALDGHYHDQAQFVRDFHEFMGEIPREYPARPHHVLATFMRERMRVAGSAVQTTDRPTVVAPPPLAR